MDIQKQKTYSYPSWYRGILLLFHLGFIMTSIFIGFIGIKEIISALVSLGNPKSGIFRGLQSVIIALLIGVVDLAALTTPVKITTTEKGLTLKLYFLFDKFISWDEVIGIKKWPFQDGFFLIKVKKLTLFHRLTGISHMYGIKPVFTIHKPLENIYDLVDRIEEHI
jgi:hypothetical protein